MCEFAVEVAHTNPYMTLCCLCKALSRCLAPGHAYLAGYNKTK